MKAFIYIALIAAILWASVTWERAHAPAPVAQLSEESATSSPATHIPAPDSGVAVKIAEEKLPAPKPSIPTSVEEPELTEPTQEVYTEEFVEALELAVHNRVNEERAIEELDVLEYDTLLAEVAAMHSTDMVQEDYFAHEDKEGCGSACRVTAAGYKWRMVGENLFLLKREYHFTTDGASAVVVAGWMGSPGHRANMFEEDFTHEGIGVVIKGDTLYVTEVL